MNEEMRLNEKGEWQCENCRAIFESLRSRKILNPRAALKDFGSVRYGPEKFELLAPVSPYIYPSRNCEIEADSLEELRELSEEFIASHSCDDFPLTREEREELSRRHWHHKQEKEASLRKQREAARQRLIRSNRRKAKQ